MGGAFTSLGADLSSMNINPAGLGMYQSSDMGITQGLSITGSRGFSSNINRSDLSSGGSRVSYGLDNVAVVFNTHNRSNTLTSLSFGFGYNRTANFNSDSYVRSRGNSSSIADMFGAQLSALYNGWNIGASDLQSSARPFDNTDILLEEWGAVLGYQTGLINSNGTDYDVALGQGALADSYTRSVTRGGIYEYSLSGGANINNVLYLGATLGISQIQYKEMLTYEETYYNQGVGTGLVGDMWYDQNTTLSGVGTTLKLGAVIRPVEAFRIGVALHLPTFYTINKHYSGEMGTDLPRTANTGALTDEQRFNTAPKLLVGASVVLAKRAILALDYEGTWYNKIRSRNQDMSEEENSRTESDNLLKPGHVLRGGAEFLVNDAMSVRLGGGYQFSMLKDPTWIANTPVAHSGYNLTAGVGFNIGRNGYVDIAYLFKHSNYTDYENYYLDNGTNAYFQYDAVGGKNVPRTYGTTKNFHLISLTFGSRF
jgi:hypothetical protein